MSFILFFWLSPSALLTMVAGLVESYLFLYCFFLSFLALLKSLESWVEMGTKILALDASL